MQKDRNNLTARKIAALSALKGTDKSLAVEHLNVILEHDPAGFENTLIELMSFLCSPEGRTNENCKYVDSYFCCKDNWFDCIERLSQELHDILFDMGGTLHDAIKSPTIAENFQSLPEQVLERIKKLNV